MPQWVSFAGSRRVPVRARSTAKRLGFPSRSRLGLLVRPRVHSKFGLSPCRVAQPLPGELSMPYNSTCAQTLRTYEASCHCNWGSRLDCVDPSCSFRSGPPRLGRLDSSFDRDSDVLWLQFPTHLGRRPGRFSPTSVVLSAARCF